MKGFILASLLVIAVSASLLEENGIKFQTFKLKHGKTYKNQVEEAKRFAIFQENLRSIEEHNALFEQELVTYTKGINQFTDMTHEEFKALLTLHTKPTINGIEYVPTGVAIPSSIDWRTQGYVTGVKDQGGCGSCWAFSVTGATEGAYFRKHGNLVSFSEQQLVDCVTNNWGCDGGFMEDTFPYIQENGIETEDSYPYEGVDGTCKWDSSKVVTKISNYYRILKNENTLLEVVGSIGPVSVSMDASFIGSYASGVFSDPQCTITNLNHGVLVVGYGSEGGQDYWIIKNSWGTWWGDQGYFKLLRGANECGLSEDDSYPIID